MKPVLSALTIGVLASLSGCGYLMGDEGYFRDRGSDYQDAQVQPRMTVPADLQSKPIGDLLPVPGQISATGVSAKDYETPRPQPMLARYCSLFLAAGWSRPLVVGAIAGD